MLLNNWLQLFSSRLRSISPRKARSRWRPMSAVEALEDRTLLTVNLSAGDLAIVGYNSDTNDFAVMALADIPANSVIHFTDRGWEGLSLRPQSGLETVTTWTTPGSAISAGTIIRISRDAPSFIGTNFGSLSGAGSMDTLSGDQILVYQTGDGNPSSAPTMITAFNGNDEGAIAPGMDTNGDGWQNATGLSGNQYSELPLGLTANFTAYGIAGQIAGGEVDNYVYNGPTTAADRTTWLIRIGDHTNWASDNGGIGSGGYDFNTAVGSLPAPGGTLSVTTVTVAPTVTAPGSPTTVNAPNFNITGTATADALVRVYSDINNNGMIDGADAVVASQQLTGGATMFSVSTTLAQDAVNNFLVTAEVASSESVPTDVPTITEDSTAPVVNSITRLDGNPSNAANVNFAVTFSEAVTGVGLADFVLDQSGLTGAAITGVTGSGTVYTVSVNTGTGDGTLSIDFDADSEGGVADAAGNVSTADFTTGEVYDIDKTRPTVVSIVRADPNPTNSVTVDFTVTFSEAVTGVGTGDFVIDQTGLTGASVTSVSGSGTTWTISVGTGTGDGTLSIDFDADASGGVTDAAGNVSTADFTGGQAYNIDKTAPVLKDFARNTPTAEFTNADTLVFDITFDGDVFNVTADDFVITGTTATGVLAGSGANYTLTISGGNLAGLNGVVGLNLAPLQNIRDSVGNALPPGEPATDETYTVDNTAPTLTAFARNTPATSPTNADSLVFNITFDVDVQNVSADDFTITGTTATGVLAGSGANYTLTLTGGDLAGLDGTVGLDLAVAQNITDAVGNALAADEPATDETYVVDNTGPALTAFARNTPATSPTNADSLVFDITFDEAVTNVSADDFTIVGTTATGVLAGSGANYTLTLSGGDLMSLENVVGLNLAVGQDITDVTGNALGAGEPATDETYLVDNTAPVLAAFARNTPASSLTNADTLVFDITFDEAVQNVSADDFDIVGTTATGVLAGSGSSYTLTINGGDLANLNGVVGLNLAAGQDITDLAGNALPAGEPATDETYTVDNTAPTLNSFARNTPASSPANADTLVFDITFSVDVQNVSADDFTITGTTATGVLAGSGANYTLTISGGDLAGLNGTVGLDLAPGQDITNLAGNALPSGEPLTDETYLVDNTAPVLTAFTRNTPATSPTSADTLVFDITFDEAVLNVSADDFTITGTTATGILAGSGANYTLTISGGDLAGLNGTVGLDLAPGQDITDVVGNALIPGEPATDETYAVDNTAPILTAFARNTPSVSLTNADTLVFNITFDEAVQNVSADDFVITGTTATGVLAPLSGSTYTLTISGGDLAGLNGTVGLNLAPGQDITNLSGIALVAGEPATDEAYDVDNIAPTVIVNIVDGTLSDVDQTSMVTFEFSQAIVGFDASDLTVTNGTISNFMMVDSDSYTATFTAANNLLGTGSVAVNAASYTDVAGNAGLGGSDSVAIDTYVPESILGRTTDGAWWSATTNGVNGFTTEFQTAWNPAAGWTDTLLADVNGDGLDDIVARNSSGQIHVNLATGTGFASQQMWGFWATSVDWQNVQAGDFNGDGKMDLFGRNQGSLWIATSTGTGFSTKYWGGWAPIAWQDVYVADFNGDGRDDIVGRDQGNWWVATSTGTNFSTQFWGSRDHTLTWEDTNVADVNGDGMMDIVSRTSGTWWVSLSNGTSFTNQTWGYWVDTISWINVNVADVNGDGMMDIIGRDNGNWWVALSTGSNFVNQYWGYWDSSLTWEDVTVGDFNGDGRDDIAGRTSGFWWVSRSTGTNFANELWGFWSDDTDWEDTMAGVFA